MGGFLDSICCCCSKNSLKKQIDNSEYKRIPQQTITKTETETEINVNESSTDPLKSSLSSSSSTGDEKLKTQNFLYNCDKNDLCENSADQYNSLTEKLLPDSDTLQHITVQPKRSVAQLRNEIEQSLAAAISDRATDEVLEALTRYRRGMGISDSPSVLLDEPQTPDIVRSRSSHDTEGMIIRPGRVSNLPKLGMESPTKLEYLNLATPHMLSKRRSIARKVRPQSVVENLSLGHIPDLLESPSSRRSNAQMPSPHDTHGNYGSTLTSANDNSLQGDDYGGDECCDSITELPSASFQLQHLVKGRPKRAKTRAPTRPLVNVDGSSVVATKEIGEGLEQFFRPGSVTPTTLTPLVSPTSDECSSLSFVDSPTMSRDGNGHMTSEETTPILEERRPIKLERGSPLLKGGPWTTRSRSTDNLEKYSPLVGRKSPLVKMRTEENTIDGNEETNGTGLLKAPERNSGGKTHSPSSDSIKSHTTTETNINAKSGNGILRTPVVLQKPRPWSVVGSEPKSDSTKTTPEKLDEDSEVVMPFRQGSSIISITTGNGKGAGLEKKSVRELAAGLSRMDLPMKPQALPRTLLTSATNTSSAQKSSSSTTSSSSPSEHAIGSNSSNISISNIINTATLTNASSITTPTTTTVLNLKQHTSGSASNQIQNKTIFTANSKSSVKSSNTNKNSNNVIRNNIGNQIISIRNGKVATNSSIGITNSSNNSNSSGNNSKAASTTSKLLISEKAEAFGGFKRVAGKEISKIFEETLVEGLQHSSIRRTLRDTHYTAEDIVDV